MLFQKFTKKENEIKENALSDIEKLQYQISYEKYKTMYEYSMKAYFETNLRHDNLSKKYSSNLTQLTFISGVYALMGRELLIRTIENDEIYLTLFDFIKIIMISMYLLSFIVLIISWIYIVRASLKIYEFKGMPLDEKTLESFNNKELLNIYRDFSLTFKESLRGNYKVNDFIASNIEKGYKNLMISLLLFLISIIFYIVAYYKVN